MPAPLTVDKPYPTTDGIISDPYSLRIISPSYSSPTGELNSALQYLYHSFYFEREGYGAIAQTLTSISMAETRHLEMLGKTILALGSAPVFAQYPISGFNYYSAKYVAYSCSLRHMLEDDIRGKRLAVSRYSKMFKRLADPLVAAIVSRICEDEKFHLETLLKILSDFKG